MNTNKGYSLIEILVVIFIIAVVSAIGTISYRDFSRKQNVVAAARSARSALTLAQTRALSGEKPPGCTGSLTGFSVRLNSVSPIIVTPPPAPSPSGTPSTQSLVGWWKFDENTGAIANDSSGKGHTGSLANTPTWINPGKYGPALGFNGSNQYVTTPNHADFNFSGPFTVEAWVYVTAFPSNFGYIVGKGFNNSTEAFYLRFTSSSLQFGSYQTNGDDTSDYRTTASISGNFSTGTWYHIAGVWDQSRWYLYRNGVQLSSTAASHGAFTNTKPVIIGATDVNGTVSRFLNGRVDNVQIYNYARTVAQIQADMSNPSPSPTATAVATLAPTATPGLAKVSFVVEALCTGVATPIVVQTLPISDTVTSSSFPPVTFKSVQGGTNIPGNEQKFTFSATGSTYTETVTIESSGNIH